MANIYEEMISFFSTGFSQGAFDKITHEPFKLPYYFSIGISLLIGGVVLIFLLNKLLLRFFNRYEDSSFGIVDNPPKLTKKQVSLLKEILSWVNHQSDGWYTAKPSCVDKALNGIRINLIDIQRLRDSTRMGDMIRDISKKDQAVFNKFEESLAKIEKELIEEVKYKKDHARIIDEMDALNKQLKISQYSAIAAIASAIATGFLTYITYINLP